MPIAREQLSTSVLDYGECSEAVHFQFVNPVGIIERSGPLQQRHGLENLHGNVNSIPKWDELLCSRQVRLNPIIVVCRSLETNFRLKFVPTLVPTEAGQE